jgi:hypothetical protein
MENKNKKTRLIDSTHIMPMCHIIGPFVFKHYLTQEMYLNFVWSDISWNIYRVVNYKLT